MPPQPPLPPPRYDVFVDERGPDEWIVDVPGYERSLHVYRLGPADWLVSEVGRSSEGRGDDLRQALAALPAGVTPVGWVELVEEALELDVPGRRSRIAD